MFDFNMYVAMAELGLDGESLGGLNREGCFRRREWHVQQHRGKAEHLRTCYLRTIVQHDRAGWGDSSRK